MTRQWSYRGSVAALRLELLAPSSGSNTWVSTSSMHVLLYASADGTLLRQIPRMSVGSVGRWNLTRTVYYSSVFSG